MKGKAVKKKTAVKWQFGRATKKTPLKCGLGFFSACPVTGTCEVNGEKEQIPGISSNANFICSIADTMPWFMGERSS